MSLLAKYKLTINTSSDYCKDILEKVYIVMDIYESIDSFMYYVKVLLIITGIISILLIFYVLTVGVF